MTKQDTPGARPLKNLDHERFAHMIVRGLKVVEAYEEIGNTGHPQNARRLRRKPDVAARINFLMTEAARVTVFDAAWIKDRLARHAEHLTEVVVDPKTGIKKPGPLFNASAGARALELLGKEAGLFKDRVELGGTVQVANRELFARLTTEERQVLRTMLVAAAARTPAPANENEPGEESEAAAK